MPFRHLFCAGSIALVALAGVVPARAAEGVTALLKRQSQAFSDASASGNAATIARYLDDNVTFMNEDGTLSTKKEILQSFGPAPSGVTQKLR